MPTSQQSSKSHGPAIILSHVFWAPEGEADVLRDVSMTFGMQKYGVVGRNGVGKTTLSRLLVGELTPTSGRVTRSATVGYLPQTLHVGNDITIAQILGVPPQGTADVSATRRVGRGGFRGDEPWDLESQARREMAALGLESLDLSRSAGSLSGGEITRLLIARLWLGRPQIVILDEPMNNLDIEARRLVVQSVAAWRGGAIVVSHDRTLLDAMDSIVELDAGRLTTFGGNFDFYEEQRGREDAAAARQLSTAKQEIKRVQKAAQKARERQERRSGRGQKLRAKSGQAKIILGVWREQSEKTASRSREVFEQRVASAHQRLVEARARIRPENHLHLEIAPVTVPEGKAVVVLHDVSFAYPGTSKRLIDHLDLRIAGSERVAIQGANGAGKTTLAELMVGKLAPTAGTARVGVSAVGYVPQSSGSLTEGESVLEAFMRISEAGEKRARQALSTVLFRGDTVFKPVEVLSGGERIRLALGAALYREPSPELLVVDEPTNHLDLDSIEQVASALQQFAGTLIVISHDERFLEDIGIERTIAMPQR